MIEQRAAGRRLHPLIALLPHRSARHLLCGAHRRSALRTSRRMASRKPRPTGKGQVPRVQNGSQVGAASGCSVLPGS